MAEVALGRHIFTVALRRSRQSGVDRERRAADLRAFAVGQSYDLGGLGTDPGVRSLDQRV
jgi:hypothetical protein